MRYHRQLPEGQVMDLSQAVLPHDYHDLEVCSDFARFGLPGGGNHKPVTVLQANGSSFWEHEAVALQAFQEEMAEGHLQAFDFPPFWPFHMSGAFFVQGKKLRRILDLKAPSDGFGVNEQREEFHTAKLDLVKVGQLMERVLWLYAVGVLMRSWGWAVGVVMGWVDLHSAYNQAGVESAGLWQNGGSFVCPLTNTLQYTLMTATQFGGEDAPRGFSRVSCGLVHACDMALEHAVDYHLQQRWRRALQEQGVEQVLEAMPVFVPRQVAGRKQPWSEQQRLNPLSTRGGPAPAARWPWNHITPEHGVTHPRPLRRTGATLSSFHEGKLYNLNGYLDDIGALMLVPKSEGAWWSGEGKAPSSEPCEQLRQAHVAGVLEGIRAKVSQRKMEEGRMARVQEHLGFLWDFRDDACPRLGIPEGKVQSLLEAVVRMEAWDTRLLDFEQMESLAHRLNSVSPAAPRGRVYINGLFQALKAAKGGPWVRRTGAVRRNLAWWRRFLGGGAPPSAMMVMPPVWPRHTAPHTDASTSWGFGGWFVQEGVCYYIHGSWTDAEQQLIQSRELGINFLEMATVLFLVEAAGNRLDRSSFTFWCDNLVSVNMLVSGKAREGKMSRLLEDIDECLIRHELNVCFDWVDTKANYLADCLSRDAFDEFRAHVTASCRASSFVQLQVPEATRDIGRVVQEACSTHDWQLSQ